MKAVLLCNETYDTEVDAVIQKTSQEDIIVIMSGTLMQQFLERKVKAHVEYIELYSDKYFSISEKIIHDIVKDLTEGNIFFQKNRLPYMTTNHLYDSMMCILVNFKFSMDEIIKRYHITTMELYGGNEKVPFLGINVGEGERLFRWIYKRKWFVNYFANKIYSERIQIVWKKKENRCKLEFFSMVRLLALNVGKVLKQYPTMGVGQPIELKNGDKKIVYLVVRVPQVVETLIPVYDVFEKSDKFYPIFVAYENYSNRTLLATLDTFNVRYVNLKSYISKGDVINKFRIIYSSKVKKKGKIKWQFAEETDFIELSAKRLIRELKVLWFDALLLETGLENLYKISNSVEYLINAETHSWVAAVQGLWAEKHNIKSVGVSFVNLIVRPRSSWMDIYFMNSQAQKELLEKARPKEKYMYVGPIGYDMFFNTANHIHGRLDTIGIFTQPDAFRSDAIRMIDVLVDIRDKYNFSWKIVVKLHPRERNVEEFKKYEDTGYVKVVFKEQTSLAVLQNIDLAMAVHSNVLEQALVVGVPAMSVNFDKVHSIPLECLKSDAITKVYTKEEILEYLNTYDDMEQIYEKERAVYIRQRLGEYQGNAAEKMYYYLQESKL